MAKNENRSFFGLKCSECGTITRRPVEKNKKNTPDKMEMKKYCPKCRKTTVMTETKLGK